MVVEALVEVVVGGDGGQRRGEDPGLGLVSVLSWTFGDFIFFHPSLHTGVRQWMISF